MQNFQNESALVTTRFPKIHLNPLPIPRSLKAVITATLFSLPLLIGCAREDVGIVTVCIPPTVISTSPSDGGANEPLSKTAAAMAAGMTSVKVISATFSTPMRPSSINSRTFILLQGNDTIPGIVSYSDTTAFFMVEGGLASDRTYTGKITTGVRDHVGTPLEADYVWTFTTIAPETPTLVSPAQGATGLAFNPTLVWNSVPGADTYRLQVSQSPGFVSTVFDDSTLTNTSHQLSGLTAGTSYYWRVNSKNSGTSGAYSDVWRFTVINTPASPSLVAPLAGSANQPTTLNMSWLASASAETYRLQISTNSNFSGILFYDSAAVGTSRTIIGLSSGTTYYWRVNASNAAGSSSYSTRTFTTVIASPPSPTLETPADAAINVTSISELDWNASDRAATYRLQVDTSSVFASTVFDDSTLTTTSREVPGLNVGTTYYWRVNAKNIGGTSSYSPTRRFTVLSLAVLKAPVLVSPADSAGNISVTPTLDWNAVVGAATYRLQVDTTAAFADRVFEDSTLTATNQSLTGLVVGKTYFWRVNAKYIGGTSAYSVVRQFTVAAVVAPQAPILDAPADSADDVAKNPDLSWNEATGADTYHLQVAVSDAFSTLIHNDSTITGESTQLTGLTEGETYFWRVRAKNSAGTSAFSSTWSFTVDASVFSTVNLRTAERFGTIGSGAGITNQGILTKVNGSIGTTGSSTLITGFHDATLPPNNVFTETPLNIGEVRDTIYTGTAPAGSVPGKVATDALADATTAFNFLKGLPPGPDPLAGELGGLTLEPGTYTAAGGTFKITLVDLTLDAKGNPNARFVFQIPSSLTVGAEGPLGARSVNLINGAQAKNVFWVVGTGGSGSATINGAGGGNMVGTIIAHSGVSFSTVGNNAITTLDGRAMSLTASVTLVNTIINVPTP